MEYIKQDETKELYLWRCCATCEYLNVPAYCNNFNSIYYMRTPKDAWHNICLDYAPEE